MANTVLYIDDEITHSGRDAEKIKELLQAPGEFECELRLPPKDVSSLPELSTGHRPDGLLVDLELSTVTASEEPVNYFGSTLASEVRMRIPSCPIVLITRPEFIGGKRQLLEENIDVDLILMKDEINRTPSEKRTEIVALIEGFKALEECKERNWDSLITLMNAEKREANLLREAAPPLVKGQWNTPQIARWIRHVVMGFPGILYDDLTAATRLGIDVDAFLSEEVQEFARDAKYTGVFSNYRNRWWRDRLFARAQELIAKHELSGPLSQKVADAFNLESGLRLEPAVCVYDETPTADWVCYVLKKPVKQRNSLLYFPDDRPSVMDQARVSFKAIQESEEFDESLVDADSSETVFLLWE